MKSAFIQYDLGFFSDNMKGPVQWERQKQFRSNQGALFCRIYF